MSHGNPEPWLRKGRGYFVTLHGKQVNLRTRDKAEAYKLWHELMADSSPQWDLPPDPLVVDLLALFCDWAEKNLAPGSYVWYRNYLHNLVKYLPERMVLSRFKPLIVTHWIDANPKWGNSGRRAAITAVKRAFSWAEQQGAIDQSPVRHMKRPPMSRRMITLTPEQKKLILESVDDECFREMLIAAELSGVRPQELCRVEARHFNAEKGTWIFPKEEHKTGAKTGRPRVVFLPPLLVEMSSRLANQWPTGPMFRNTQGKPWKSNAVRLRFKRIKKRLAEKVPSNLCLYLYRHTFATDALEQGLNPMTVAELLGHADASTLSRVYQHLADRHDHMSQAVAQATEGSASQ